MRNSSEEKATVWTRRAYVSHITRQAVGGQELLNLRRDAFRDQCSFKICITALDILFLAHRGCGLIVTMVGIHPGIRKGKDILWNQSLSLSFYQESKSSSRPRLADKHLHGRTMVFQPNFWLTHDQLISNVILGLMTHHMQRLCPCSKAGKLRRVYRPGTGNLWDRLRILPTKCLLSSNNHNIQIENTEIWLQALYCSRQKFKVRSDAL